MPMRACWMAGCVAGIVVLHTGGIARAQCDGAVFGPPSAGVNGPVFDVVQTENGDLVIGGGFSHFSDWRPARSMARWDGSAWSEFGGGSDAAVTKLALLPGGGLMAFGSFTQIGGVAANGAAWWDGATWHSLGIAPGLWIGEMLPLDHGDVLACVGDDVQRPPNRLMRLSQGQWTQLAAINGHASDLKVLPGGDVLIAGLVNGTPPMLAQRWDGESWLPVGSAIRPAQGHFTGAICAAVTSGGEVVVGGAFEVLDEDGSRTFNVARLEGGQWARMGGGLDGYVWSMAVLPGGDIAAGGPFPTSAGQDGCLVARWDGLVWRCLAPTPPAGAWGVGALRVTPNGGLLIAVQGETSTVYRWEPASADFDGDGDVGTDADIAAFFACLGGNCCSTCYGGGADFNGDGNVGTDADIESFFRVLAGGVC